MVRQKCSGIRRSYLAGKEQLQVASVNLVLDEDKIVEQLINLLGINTQ